MLRSYTDGGCDYEVTVTSERTHTHYHYLGERLKLEGGIEKSACTGGAPLVTDERGFADDLSAQGSGLRARQTKGSPHAPEKLTPTPAVNLILGLDSSGFVFPFRANDCNCARFSV